jgi:hypothetical protein
MANQKPHVTVSKRGIASVRPRDIMKSERGREQIRRTAEVIEKVRKQQSVKRER